MHPHRLPDPWSGRTIRKWLTWSQRCAANWAELRDDAKPMLRRLFHFPLHARTLKRPVAIMVDGALLLAATWLAFSVRLEGFHRPQGLEWAAYGLSVALALPAFGFVGLYRSIVRFSGVATFLAIAKGIALYAFAFSVVLLSLRPEGVPRSLSIIQPLLALLFVASWRLAVRVWYGRATPRHGRAPRRNSASRPRRCPLCARSAANCP